VLKLGISSLPQNKSSDTTGINIYIQVEQLRSIGCENATRLAGKLFQCPVNQGTSISLTFNRIAESLPNYLSYERNRQLWSWWGKHGTLYTARHCLGTASQPAVIGWIKNSSLSICVRNEIKTSRSVARLETVLIASSVRRSVLPTRKSALSDRIQEVC